MKTYEIVFQETVTIRYTVEAESAQEAYEKIRDYEDHYEPDQEPTPELIQVDDRALVGVYEDNNPTAIPVTE